MDASALSPQMLKDLSVELGFDIYDEMDAEGGRLWDTLNDLSANPAAYQEFISRQNQRQQSSSLAMPPFVPYSGFVVRSFVSKEKLWVNICKHDSVSKPFHGSGVPVADSCPSMEGLQIPLLVSKLRKLCDGDNEALVVDVVVHSWCIEACRNPSFKMQLIDLVLQSIENDHSVKVLKHDAERVFAYTISTKSNYKGGLGPDSKPLPFEPHERSSNETKLDSPEDLLKCREIKESTSKSKELSLKMPGTAPSNVGATLVQPINEKIVSKQSGFRSGFLTAYVKPTGLKDKSTGDSTSGFGGSDGESEDCLDKATEVVGVEVEYGDSRRDSFLAHSPSLDANSPKPEGEDNCVGTDITWFKSKNELIVHIELSCCRPSIQTTNDLKLLVSKNSLFLEATKCEKQWKLTFPSPLDNTSVSAKLRAKSHKLVITFEKRQSDKLNIHEQLGQLD
ncbi:hypothetical protein HJC23_009054 [Cyclotella cryptica]|uniref:PIH1 domain-containing protein 1 n=1 Tax=Cyclotella cryptica TaxID=29204 RepID=A0ABD3QYG1_9STRA